MSHVNKSCILGLDTYLSDGEFRISFLSISWTVVHGRYYGTIIPSINLFIYLFFISIGNPVFSARLIFSVWLFHNLWWNYTVFMDRKKCFHGEILLQHFKARAWTFWISFVQILNFILEAIRFKGSMSIYFVRNYWSCRKFGFVTEMMRTSQELVTKIN